MSQFAIQHVRFFRPKTSAVHCLAYDTYSNKIALSRSDGSVEIYRLHNDGVRILLDVVLSPITDPESAVASVEAISWYQGRLFIASNNGILVEYDLEKLNVKRSLFLDSSPIWTIAASKSNHSGGGILACGCESGNVYLVNLVSPDSLEDCLELGGPSVSHGMSRVLSIAWLQDSNYLVTGGTGSIIVWKVKENRLKTAWQLSLPDNVIVWSLVAYPCEEPLFASSDSRGMVSIWNAKLGTAITELTTHQLDVLTLSVGKIQSAECPVIFASGADPTVVCISPFSMESVSNVDSWMACEVHREHERDVRASCFLPPDLILTGGVDQTVNISRINTIPRHRKSAIVTFIHRLMPVFSWNNFVSVKRISSSQSVLAISQPSNENDNTVEIWQLLATSDDYDKDDPVPSIQDKQEPPRQLAMKLEVKNPPHIVKLSPLANFLAFATGSIVHAFKLDIRSPSASKHFVTNFEGSKKSKTKPAVTAIDFIDEPTQMPLVALSADGQLMVKSCWNPDVSTVFNRSKDFSEEGDLPALFLNSVQDTSNDNKWSIAIGSRTSCCLYTLEMSQEAFSLKYLCKIPSYANGSITAVSLHSPCVAVVAYSDRRIAEFDGHEKKMSKWTKKTIQIVKSQPIAKKRRKSKNEKSGGDKPQAISDKSDSDDDIVAIDAYPAVWQMQQDPITWVGYADSMKTKILTASSKLVATIDKNAKLPLTIDSPLFGPKTNRSGSPSQTSIRFTSRFRFILAFDCLKAIEEDEDGAAEEAIKKPGQLFVAELPPAELRAQLPGTIVTKKQYSA